MSVFRWDGIQPSFLVSCESSDSGVIRPLRSGGAHVSGVVAVSEDVVDLGVDSEAGGVFFVGFFSAKFF